MRIIVITGSTRGIGYGLAERFLERGHAVVISGRSAGSVDPAVESLRAAFAAERVLGQPCDVREAGQVAALWQAAADHFGRVDIWINNAGMHTTYGPAYQQDIDSLRTIVEVNLLGGLYGLHIPYNRMLEQGSGQIYTMEGHGSNGRIRAGQTVYGASKYGLDYLTRAWIDEMPDDSPVRVGILSPGMVVTDLLTGNFNDPADFERARPIFNILADKVETVTPWLADRILADDQNGSAFRWLTQPKILWRFATAAFNKRDLFDDES